MTRRNWAGNLAYRARRLHHPSTLEQLAEIMASAASIRVLGSRHSFNDIADATEQVSLDALSPEFVVDRDAATVSFGAWLTYGQVADALSAQGLALANLASLPHISVGGAIATATHGSGDQNGNLATSVGPEAEVLRPDLFGARATTLDRHPIIGIDPVNATRQLGAPGPWSDRLPHFRMGFTPSSGDELQSEYLVPRRHAPAAIEAILTLSELIHPLIQVAEIRTVAADRLWMSPAYEHDLVAFHFTWIPDDAAVRSALSKIERVLAPFEARPHWGKLFNLPASAIAPLYPRHDAFLALRDRLDPRGAFRNDWLRRVLGD